MPLSNITIGNVGTSSSAKGARVTALVDNIPVWFESTDIDLRESPEAFGSFLLIPAAASGRRLSISDPVCATWYENASKVLAVANEWWQYDTTIPIAKAEKQSRVPISANALCFSGGADSFYTLLEGTHHPQCLVFVHGFDMLLTDTVRAEACERSTRQIADSFGLKTIVVRTNLREHPVISACNWELSHGGALAAIGHVVSNQAGRLVVPPSYPVSYGPWGSHAHLMPLWSSSSMIVECADKETWRRERIAAICNQEIVRQHLRVCFENQTPTGNCSACRKCITTMLILAENGCLDKFTVFDHTMLLADRIDRMPPLKNKRHCESYDGFVKRGNIDKDTSAAIDRLIVRSAETVRRHEQKETWSRHPVAKLARKLRQKISNFCSA